MSPTAPHQTPPPLDPAHVRPVIAGLMLAMFLSALEQTIVAPALAAIGRSLNDVGSLSWVVTAYLLSATVATPLFGKLSDIYGRRAMMLIAVAIFLLGSLACALAPSMGALILARALQGLGGGGILPLAQTVIADILTPRERPIFQSYSSVMFMAASVLGPLAGGFLTDYLHWSFIFWIMLPLGVVALAMTDRALKLIPRNDRPHKLDVVGAALMVVAAVLLLLALSWGGVRYPWGSLQVIALLVASALLWTAFARRIATAPEPFIPPELVCQPLIALIIVASFFAIGTLIGLSIVVPLYLELVLGFSASGGGVALIFYVIGTSFGSLSSGHLVGRLTHYKRVPMLALPLSIATFLLLAWMPAGWSLPGVCVVFAINGFGVGTMYPFTTVMTQNAVEPHRFGIATGTLNFFRQLGGAIITAVFVAIVLGGLEGGEGARLLATLTAHGASSTARAAGTAQFAPLFSLVFLCAAGFLTAALLAVIIVEERPLRGPATRVKVE
ncbi:MAG TPA: MDR family MFS transporter [Xanthobacteraceae bacterium]|nr:MDR family MFS transporter [Xanthobacteraceae bacterium]